MKRVQLLFSVLGLAFLALVGCTPGGGGGGEVATDGPPIVTKVSRDNYLGGKAFCETYKEITSQEYGVWVKVPKSYDQPEGETLEIYAYTDRPFNPNWPSLIYADGGPGQNTHGFGDFVDRELNQIRFDQRGLGCSAPATYDEYLNADLYSTLNTIRDMEAIRKAFGIEKWTVFGVSYGTVPATMYGSTYPESTVAVMLEGVVGLTSLIHPDAYKAEKLNLVIEGFNSAQRLALYNLWTSEDENDGILISFIFSFFYYDKGLRTAQSFLNALIQRDGVINEELKK